MIVAVAAMIASVVALAPSTAQAGPKETTPRAEAFAGNALAGFEQVTVTDLDPGTEVDLIRLGEGEGKKGKGKSGDLAVADDLGSVMFRLVEPGNYVVEVDGVRSSKLSVRSIDEPHPDQEFYDSIDIGPGYQYLETRDGTKLSINVVLPGPPEDGPYPTVVEYSGYDPSNPTSSALPGIPGPAQPGSALASVYGYAVVGVNVRGTGCSGGAYDFFEPMQLFDGYDAIEAVAAQPWVQHHRVGMVGLSYPGITQLFVGSTNPPNLAAITPLSVYGDTGTGIARPGGLPNQGFALSWAENVLNSARPYPDGAGWVRTLIDEGDDQCAENQKLRLQNVDAAQKALDNPFYTEDIAAPLDTRNFVGDIEAAVFMTSAWQDEQTGPSFGDILGEFDSAEYVRQTVFNGNHADGFAPQVLTDWAAFLDIYVAQRPPEPNALVSLFTPVLTEGIFGGPLTMPPTCCQGAADVDEARAMFESESPVQIIFENGGLPGELEGLPLGVGEFGTTDWPVPGTTAERWYFHPDGSMRSNKTSRRWANASFRPDPDVGLTTYWNGSVSNIWHAKPEYNWEPAGNDQAVVFETAPLDGDRTMIGTGSVDLWLKSTADDADLEVILSEIRPDGHEMLVQTGVLRASYRRLDKSSTELQPVQYGRPGEVRPLKKGWNEVRVQIPAFAHEFRTGSKVRITINTPGGDEPRWAYILDENITEDDRHFISVGRRRASSVALPIVDSFDLATPLPGCPSLRGQPCRPAPPIENTIARRVRR